MNTTITKDYLIDETAIYKYIIGLNTMILILTYLNIVEPIVYYISGLGLLMVLFLGIFGYASKTTSDIPFNITMRYKIQVLLAIITTVPTYVLMVGQTRFNDVILAVLTIALIMTMLASVPRERKETPSHN
jgi:hypothetical protein